MTCPPHSARLAFCVTRAYQAFNIPFTRKLQGFKTLKVLASFTHKKNAKPTTRFGVFTWRSLYAYGSKFKGCMVMLMLWSSPETSKIGSVVVT